MSDRGVDNAVKELGVPKAIAFGFQHVFTMFGATVIVPLLSGLSISVTLFAVGIATLWFHFVTKRKVPVFLGSSFAFLAAYESIGADKMIWEMAGVNVSQYVANANLHMLSAADKALVLPYLTGGVMAAGFIHLAVGLIVHLVGFRKVMKLFPPVVTGPIIVLIGLVLAPTAVSSLTTSGNPKLFAVGLLALVMIVALNVFGKGMLKLLPVLVSIAVSYVVAMILGVVDFQPIAQARVVALPPFMFPKFAPISLVTFAIVSIATIIEHVGDVSAIGAVCNKNFIDDPGLARTLMGDGGGSILSSLFGGPATTTYSENTGVIALTGIRDPFVVEIAAVIAIIFSFSPKIDAVVSSIPSTIIGGVSFVLYGMISAVGLRTVIENKVDLNIPRNLVIVAVILVSGLGFEAHPLVIGSFRFGGLACAAVFGIVLNLVLREQRASKNLL